MDTPPAHHITVNQCLFGYDDGHRLLASSINLHPEAASLLLVMSDLAPGVSFVSSRGYWTGVPLLKAKAYALLHTWPAPEMPRPGCVWTHALIISFADLGRIPDLGQLQHHFHCPSGGNLIPYTIPFTIAATRKDWSDPAPSVQPMQWHDALSLLRATYGTASGRGIVEAPAGELDNLVFALWSQQWPKLRRSFAFQTASARVPSTITGVRFHLQILAPSLLSLSLADQEKSASEPWEEYTLKDLLSPEPTDLRRFLWRYGADVRRGRERFRFLTNLYAFTRWSHLAGKELLAVLTAMVETLPELDDGKTLKEDLLRCCTGGCTLLPSTDLVDTIAFLIHNRYPTAMPALPLDAFSVLGQYWHERSNEILSLAEQALERESSIAAGLLEQINQLISPANFLASTKMFSRVRSWLAKAKPELLDSDALIEEPAAGLIDLLQMLPGEGPVLGRLLGRLVIVENVEIAQEMFTRFQSQTLSAVIHAIEHERSSGPRVAPAWLALVAMHRQEVLGSGIIETLNSRRGLARIAVLMGLDSREVLDAGADVWAQALRQAKDDLEGRDRQRFFVFLFVVALHRPRSGSEALFEIAFDEIHFALAEGRLDAEALDLLVRHLPDVPFWLQWDLCLRLRIAVVRAYADYDLNPSSFAALSKSREVMKALFRASRRTERGSAFIKKVVKAIRDNGALHGQ